MVVSSLNYVGKLRNMTEERKRKLIYSIIASKKELEGTKKIES
jgi:hypothetical protein